MLQAFEQFGALYMHTLDQKHQTWSGFNLCTTHVHGFNVGTAAQIVGHHKANMRPTPRIWLTVSNTSLTEMSISIAAKLTIYRSLYDNTDPGVILVLVSSLANTRYWPTVWCWFSVCDDWPTLKQLLQSSSTAKMAAFSQLGKCHNH